MRSFITTLFLVVIGNFFHTNSCAQLSSPDITCTQVDVSGNTAISWVPVSDPGNEFVAYHVFASFNGGVFTEIGQVFNVNLGTYTDVTNNANAAQVCYYIVVEFNSGAGNTMAPAGPTVCNVQLSATASSSPQGFIDVSWTPMVGALGYTLVWDDATSVWSHSVPIGSGQNTYSLEVTTCGELLSFMVFANFSGCSFISNTASGVFYDQTPPEIPAVIAASVVNGHPQLTWEPSTSADTDGYIVYSCDGATVTILDTVWNENQTSYDDLTVMSATQTSCYLLSAFDGCVSGTPPSPNTSPTGNTCQCTLLLGTPQQVECSANVILNWTAYTGWGEGVYAYVVYEAFDAGAFVPVDTLYGDVTNYAVQQGFQSFNLSFFIEAISNLGKTSNSNVQAITLSYPTPPTYTYLSSASVNLNNSVTVTVQSTLTTDLHLFVLQQYNTILEEWEEIDVANNMILPVEFVVNDIYPQSFSYQYRVAVLNLCGDTVNYSNIGKTIQLEGIIYDDIDKNTMKWTLYEGWDNSVLSQAVERKDGQNGFFTEIALQGPLSQYYEDDIEPMFQSSGLFIYRIKAVEIPSQWMPDTSFVTYSNPISMLQDPKVYVPNAFVVGGVNSTFGPVITFAYTNDYSMFVYSKWGDVLFESHQYNHQWDGKSLDGKDLPNDVYTYFIRFRNGNQDYTEQRGTVALLRAEQR